MRRDAQRLHLIYKKFECKIQIKAGNTEYFNILHMSTRQGRLTEKTLQENVFKILVDKNMITLLFNVKKDPSITRYDACGTNCRCCELPAALLQVTLK